MRTLIALMTAAVVAIPAVVVVAQDNGDSPFNRPDRQPAGPAGDSDRAPARPGAADAHARELVAEGIELADAIIERTRGMLRLSPAEVEQLRQIVRQAAIERAHIQVELDRQLAELEARQAALLRDALTPEQYERFIRMARRIQRAMREDDRQHSVDESMMDDPGAGTELDGPPPDETAEPTRDDALMESPFGRPGMGDGRPMDGMGDGMTGETGGRPAPDRDRTTAPPSGEGSMAALQNALSALDLDRVSAARAVRALHGLQEARRELARLSTSGEVSREAIEAQLEEVKRAVAGQLRSIVGDEAVETLREPLEQAIASFEEAAGRRGNRNDRRGARQQSADALRLMGVSDETLRDLGRLTHQARQTVQETIRSQLEAGAEESAIEAAVREQVAALQAQAAEMLTAEQYAVWSEQIESLARRVARASLRQAAHADRNPANRDS